MPRDRDKYSCDQIHWKVVGEKKIPHRTKKETIPQTLDVLKAKLHQFVLQQFAWYNLREETSNGQLIHLQTWPEARWLRSGVLRHSGSYGEWKKGHQMTLDPIGSKRVNARRHTQKNDNKRTGSGGEQRCISSLLLLVSLSLCYWSYSCCSFFVIVVLVVLC